MPDLSTFMHDSFMQKHKSSKNISSLDDKEIMLSFKNTFGEMIDYLLIPSF